MELVRAWRPVWRPIFLLIRFTFRFVGVFLRDRRQEPIDRWVGWAGYAVLLGSVGASARWQDGAIFNLNDAFSGLWPAAENAPLAVLVACLIMVLSARRGARRESLTRLALPAAKAICFPAGVAGILWMGNATVAAHYDQDPRIGVKVAGLLLLFLLIFAGTAAIASVVWYAPRGLFGARDAHPHLRPLAIIVMTCALLIETATGFWGGSEAELPNTPAAELTTTVLTIVGVGVPLALAVLEMWWLAKYRGVRFRSPEPRRLVQRTWQDELWG